MKRLDSGQGVLVRPMSRQRLARAIATDEYTDR